MASQSTSRTKPVPPSPIVPAPSMRQADRERKENPAQSGSCDVRRLPVHLFPLRRNELVGDFNDDVFLSRHDLASAPAEKDISSDRGKFLGPRTTGLRETGKHAGQAADHAGGSMTGTSFIQLRFGQVGASSIFVKVDARSRRPSACKHRHEDFQLRVPAAGPKPRAQPSRMAAPDSRAASELAMAMFRLLCA